MSAAKRYHISIFFIIVCCLAIVWDMVSRIAYRFCMKYARQHLLICLFKLIQLFALSHILYPEVFQASLDCGVRLAFHHTFRKQFIYSFKVVSLRHFHMFESVADLSLTPYKEHLSNLLTTEIRSYIIDYKLTQHGETTPDVQAVIGFHDYDACCDAYYAMQSLDVNGNQCAKVEFVHESLLQCGKSTFLEDKYLDFLPNDGPSSNTATGWNRWTRTTRQIVGSFHCLYPPISYHIYSMIISIAMIRIMENVICFLKSAPIIMRFVFGHVQTSDP